MIDNEKPTVLSKKGKMMLDDAEKNKGGIEDECHATSSINGEREAVVGMSPGGRRIDGGRLGRR